MLLKLVPEKTDIHFINLRKKAFILSLVMIVGSFGLYFTKGLNYGIDFEGGIMIEIGTETPANIRAIREAMASLNMGDVRVQEFGTPTEVSIRLEHQEGLTQDEVVERVREVLPDAVEGEISYRKTDTVGSTVSGELITSGIMSVGFALGAVLIYIWLRFEWQFGMGALEIGYEKAISTIIDANVTTFIAAFFLFQFGSGPIKGFAVTLAIGILTSMFTAVSLSRMVISTWARKTRPTTLKI